MRPRKEGSRRRSNSSPARDRALDSTGLEPRLSGSHPSRVPRAASLFDREFVTEDITGFEALRISPDYNNPNPRSFPYSIKQQCWEKAEKIKGRDPDRWRRDALGNILFRKLVGCPGCLCYDYDHILPYSKGGKSTLENCQVLQLIGRRVIGPRYPKLISYRRALIVGFQGVTWILLNFLPLAMFIVGRTWEVVVSNDQGERWHPYFW